MSANFNTLLSGDKVTLRSIQGPPFVSDRGAELFCDGVTDVPVLTVENYLKWYSLFVIFPDGHVERLEADRERALQAYELEVDFIDSNEESAYGDHIFNPSFVVFLAHRLGMDLCTSALEVIIGRWELERNRTPFALHVVHNTSSFPTELLRVALRSCGLETTREQVANKLSKLFPKCKIHIGGHHVAVVDSITLAQTVLITGIGKDWK